MPKRRIAYCKTGIGAAVRSIILSPALITPATKARFNILHSGRKSLATVIAPRSVKVVPKATPSEAAISGVNSVFSSPTIPLFGEDP